MEGSASGSSFEDHESVSVPKSLRGSLYNQLQVGLSAIPKEYKTSGAFNPMPSVIRVLDPQFAGTREEKLDQLENQFEQMEDCMNLIVDEYYQGFNESVKNYSHILTHVTNSQQSVTTLRENIEKTKKALASRSKALKLMWKQNVEYKEILEILDKVQELKAIPQRLNEFNEAKQFFAAAKLLVEATSTLFDDSLLDIGALNELRKELVERKNTYHETLIDELHTFLYSSSLSSEEKETEEKRHSSRMLDLTEKDSEQPHWRNPAVRQPVKQIVDALYHLHQIPYAMSTIMEQVYTRLKGLLNETVDNCLSIAEFYKIPEGEVTLANKTNPLVKLLSLLFPKCIQILENHNFLLDLMHKHQNTETKKTAEFAIPVNGGAGSAHVYTLENVWIQMQTVLESLLKTHLQVHEPGQTNSKVKSVTQSKKSKLFSFSCSSAATFTANKNAPQHELINVLLLKPSPYNVIPIFPQIVQFNQGVEQRFGELLILGIDVAMLLHASAPSFKWTELAGIPSSALEPRTSSLKMKVEDNSESSSWVQIFKSMNPSEHNRGDF